MLGALPRLRRPFGEEPKWHNSSFQPEAGKSHRGVGRAYWSMLSQPVPGGNSQTGEKVGVFGHLASLWKEGWNLTPTVRFLKPPPRSRSMSGLWTTTDSSQEPPQSLLPLLAIIIIDSSSCLGEDFLCQVLCSFLTQNQKLPAKFSLRNGL